MREGVSVPLCTQTLEPKGEQKMTECGEEQELRGAAS